MRENVNKYLERINLKNKEFDKLKKTPKGCIKILREYIPKSENILEDYFIGLIENRLFRQLEKVKEKEQEEILKEYNNLYFKKDLEFKNTLEEYNKNYDIEDEDYEKEPSDLELKLLEKIL